MTTRRDVVAGMAAGAAMSLLGSGHAFAAAADVSLFAGTPLAGNRVARHFKRVDLMLPDIPVQTVAGRSALSGVGGKSRLIALWAEWCVPCLVEIRDFAALRPQVATDRFDIGLLLTASTAKLDHARAVTRLRPLGAASLPLLVEPDGGKRAAERLAHQAEFRPGPDGKAPPFSLPCTLLVDSRGRVKGRAFGAPSIRAPMDMAALTDEQKAAMKRGESVVVKSQPLTEQDKNALLADGKTIWSSPAGADFLKALGDGLLDRV